MNYTELVSTLENLLQIDSGNDTAFEEILPTALNDAQGRIYREVDFLQTRTVDSASTFTLNSRNFTLPEDIIICQGIAAISPAGQTPSAGTRNTLQQVSLEFIDFTWPQAASSTGIPQYFAMLSNTQVVVAPTPAAAYTAEVTGIFRPDYISETNSETYVSINYPDILVASAMVFLTGYQRDWGAQADDPKMAISWEGHYQTNKTSVIEEEQRRKGQSTGWTPFSPAPLAQPQRS